MNFLLLVESVLQNWWLSMSTWQSYIGTVVFQEWSILTGAGPPCLNPPKKHCYKRCLNLLRCFWKKKVRVFLLVVFIQRLSPTATSCFCRTVCAGRRTHPRERYWPYLLTRGVSPFSASSRWAGAQNWIAHPIARSRSIITSSATFTSLHIQSLDLHWLAITIHKHMSNNLHLRLCLCHMTIFRLLAKCQMPLDESRFNRFQSKVKSRKTNAARDSTFIWFFKYLTWYI